MILLDLCLVLLALWATGATGQMLLSGVRSGVLPGQRGADDQAQRVEDPRRFRRYFVFYLVGFAASIFFLGRQLLELWRHVS